MESQFKLTNVATHSETQEKMAVYQLEDNYLIMTMNDLLIEGFKSQPKKIIVETFERELKINSFYRHYKNKNYFILQEATDIRTGEEYVIYVALYGDFGIWARPKQMFLETTEYNGEIVTRFTEVDNIF